MSGRWYAEMRGTKGIGAGPGWAVPGFLRGVASIVVAFKSRPPLDSRPQFYFDAHLRALRSNRVFFLRLHYA